MAFFSRKMFVVLKQNPLQKPPTFSEIINTICLSCPPENCPHECEDFPSDDHIFIPPPPPIISDNNNTYHMPFYFILMLCVLGGIFLFICYMIILRKYRSNSRIWRNINPSLNENREDFIIDENLGPVLDHPIWYIRTIGLTQEIIDSIVVFKYKKDDSLIEGSDCSVCLSEFEENESLRLLPKCSHAFHIPCIDTWLRSHKNCPLCRAPIVSDMDNNVPRVNDVLEVSITNVGDGTSSNEVEIGRHNDQSGNLEEGTRDTGRGVGNLEDEEGRRTVDLSMKTPRLVDERTKGVRVFSDLVEHRVKVNDEMQPPRRSVSMDSSSSVAHAIRLDLGNIEGCSSSSDVQLVERNKGSLDVMSKRGRRNSSFYKVMKSSSFGRSLQKVPTSVKRSLSTSGNCSLPTTGRIQHPKGSSVHESFRVQA